MKIVVLLGGTSPEREVSLRSGGGVAGALLARGHRVTLLDTGTGRILRTPEEAVALGSRRAASRAAGPGTAAAERWKATLLRARRSIDAVFVALHGGDGEDGTVQGWLSKAGIPFTGSGPLSSGLAMDKAWAKWMFRQVGIPTPGWLELRIPARARPGARVPEILESDLAALGGFPLVAKPNSVGSSVGITIVRARDLLRRAILTAARYDPRVLLEEFIPGRELTVAVLEGRAFPVVEVIPSGEFYDYKRKYTAGASRYEVPATLPPALADSLQELSVRAFREFGCGGVVRVDFRLRGDGAAFCLEINTVPGLTELSLVPMAARAAGLSYEGLVVEMVEAARAGEGAGTKRGPAGAAALAVPGTSR
jgi:D-alanine-D-alanine ligase